MDNAHIRIFQIIAPIYGLFYAVQKRTYKRTVARYLDLLDLPNDASFLDVGCGTGAFCSVLKDYGYDVTGVDPAENMLMIARRKNRDGGIRFVNANALEGLPFPDNAFDCVYASFVAHGFSAEERERLYCEMGRVTKDTVFLNDYNQKKSVIVDFVEHLEKSDYKNFIQTVENELQRHFTSTRTIQVGPGTAWYVGQKKKHPANDC